MYLIKAQGFHLLEVIIVLALISMIAVWSVPKYTAYLVKARRLEAAHVLMQVAVAAEKYHIEHDSYESMTLAALHVSSFIVDHHYQLILNNPSATEYSLIAKPLNAQAQRDTACGSLTLNAIGERGVTGSAQLENCW